MDVILYYSWLHSVVVHTLAWPSARSLETGRASFVKLYELKTCRATHCVNPLCDKEAA